jgi:hypothetical protein
MKEVEEPPRGIGARERSVSRQTGRVSVLMAVLDRLFVKLLIDTRYGEQSSERAGLVGRGPCGPSGATTEGAKRVRQRAEGQKDVPRYLSTQHRAPNDISKTDRREARVCDERYLGLWTQKRPPCGHKTQACGHTEAGRLRYLPVGQ